MGQELHQNCTNGFFGENSSFGQIVNFVPEDEASS